jgi:hypothetical protein
MSQWLDGTMTGKGAPWMQQRRSRLIDCFYDMHDILLYICLYLLFLVGYLVNDMDGGYIDIYFVTCIFYLLLFSFLECFRIET